MPEPTRDTFRLIACPTLSHETRSDTYVKEGATVGDALRGLGWKTHGLSARVFIDGQLIEGAEWEMAEPTSGQAVVVRRIMSGGGGGNGGKQIGMLVGMIALMAASFFIGGGALASFLPTALQMVGTVGGWQAVGAAVLVGGSLALNALIQPSRPRIGALSDFSGSPTLSLTGSSNEANPYGRIPRLYGKHRIYPPLAARPYTEIVGNQQYMRLLYCMGYGPLAFSRDDIQIGETKLTQFSGYELQIAYGYPGEDWTSILTLVPDDVIEESSSLKITAAVSWQQRTTQLNAKEISIDLSFPEGVIRYDGSQRATEWSVAFDLEYRKVGTPGWTLVGGATAVAATVTTNFTGTNNDLIFTKVSAGVRGNTNVIRFVNGLSVSVAWEMVEILNRGGTTPIFVQTDVIIITVVQGVTTAAQVKTAFDAATTVSSIISCANAPSNNGTGAITLPSQQMWSYNVGNYTVFTQSFTFAGGRDAIPSFSVTGQTRSLVRKSVRWDVFEPGAQFDIRLRRTTADVHPNGDQLYDTAYWTMLRTIQAAEPVQKEGLCLIALRIKATDQLNGTVDTLNVVAQSVLPDYDSATDTWVLRQTSNPASIYRDVLQGTANRRPKTDAQLDLATIQGFHGRCATNDYTFNAVIDSQTTVRQLRQDVLAAGRATFGLRDMKYSVVEDLLQTIPVDIVTPRTTSGFKWTRRFVQFPHGFRVRFVDETNNYKQSEKFVYADGYSELNAVDLEEVDAGLGVTNPTQVHKLKRRELADASLRADDYEVTVDFSNLNYTRGDRVQLQHDVILAGLTTARIKAVTLDGGSNATAISFDEPFVMAADTTYGARIRKSNGTQLVQQLVTTPGEVLGVTFSVAIPAGSVPAIGDLVTFGTLGQESIDCIVKSVEPGPDFTASVVLQDYAPGIHTSDTDIPDYNAQVSWPDIPDPSLPTVIQAISDESVLVRDLDGSLQSRILVSVHFPSQGRSLASRLETQFRQTGSDDEWKVIFTDVTATSVEVPIRPVEDGLLYDIRIRALDNRSNFLSLWALINAHKVIGKTTVPPDVSSLVIEGDRLRWSYDNPPRDLAGFYVRYRAGTSREWEGAIPAHTQIILTTDFQVYRQSELATYLVKAVDTSGNLSATPAVVTVSFTDQVLDNVVVTVDHDALGFPGTKTNCTVVSGDLKANGAGGLFWTGESDLLWPFAGGDLYWTIGSYDELQYEFSYSVTADLLDAILKMEIVASGEYKIEYRTDSATVMWNAQPTTTMWNASASTLMWSAKGAYTAWPGQLSPLKYGSYDFKITGSSGGVQSVIDQLALIFDVQDVEESFANFALAPGGTRLPLTKTYRVILVVVPTLNESGSTAVYVKTIDKSLSGPLLQAFDSTLVGVAANVDVIVQGY